MKILNIFLWVILTSNSIFAQSNQEVPTQNAFPNLRFEEPVDLTYPNDGTDRLFVVQKSGKINVFENNPNTTTSTEFLNITSKVFNSGECGFLGLAFHPNYKTNGYFFVNYTAQKPLRTVIARFQVDPKNPNRATPESFTIIMEIPQPYKNHNGGQIVFGPDGFLYIGMGDGGSGGDPQNNGQNLKTLLGKMLRIDVNHSTNGLNYGIPTTNPFAENSNGYKEEIYAYGLRNPWRYSFDSKTKKIWCADVGQNLWEEIDIIVSGGNYGWNLYEGNHIFKKNEPVTSKEIIPPVFEYPHSNNNISIIGGYVYRGKRCSDLEGFYIYGDFVSKNIWKLNPENRTNNLITLAAANIFSFGVDSKNELYILGSNGLIFEFTPDIKAPSNLKINLKNSEVELNWQDNSDNETGFLIEKKNESNIYVNVAYVGRNITAYKDKMGQADRYDYRVTAINKKSTSNYSNVASINKQ